MTRSLRTSLVLVVISAAAAQAQTTRTLTGTVVGAEVGIPFAGAEIRLLDSDVRVCADVSGNFSLPVPVAGESRVRITPVGYEPQEIVVATGEQSVEVSLGDHVFVLDEVRVVGYAMSGAAARASGSSVGRLDGKDLANSSTVSLEAAMQGKIAGAHIQSNTGEPGGGYSIQLRGVNTILGNADPLLIVDGIVVNTSSMGTGANAITNAGPVGRESVGTRLSDINPADVEKIEVLRGPSASAMYGSRAGNGVVIVTTRRGLEPPEDDGRSGEVLQCFLPASGMVQIR